jgi:hypothetical protein
VVFVFASVNVVELLFLFQPIFSVTVGQRVYMMQILCPHVCKWKSVICRNDSRNGGGGEFTYDIFDIL